MDWQRLRSKLRPSRLEVLVIVLIVAALAIMVDLAIVGAGHGYRYYVFEGIVRDARTGQPIVGATLSLTMRHRRSRDPSRIISRDMTWLDIVGGERGSVPTTGEDGSFHVACTQVYGVWQTGCRGGKDPPVHQCIVTSSHEGYVVATVEVAPPPEPNDGRVYTTSGMLVELEPRPRPD